MLPTIRLLRSELLRIRCQRRIRNGQFPADYKFEQYREADAVKRVEFQKCLDALNCNPSGLCVLELGPAFGTFMDMCREQGACRVDFAEIDPAFYRHNQLKRCGQAFSSSILTQLDQLPKKTYDVIWIKAAIEVRFFGRLFSIYRWLDKVEELAAPGGLIVLVPHWQPGQETNCQFTEDVLAHNYGRRYIRGFNLQPNYPITFVKRVF